MRFIKANYLLAIAATVAGCKPKEDKEAPEGDTEDPEDDAGEDNTVRGADIADSTCQFASLTRKLEQQEADIQKKAMEIEQLSKSTRACETSVADLDEQVRQMELDSAMAAVARIKTSKDLKAVVEQLAVLKKEHISLIAKLRSLDNGDEDNVFTNPDKLKEQKLLVEGLSKLEAVINPAIAYLASQRVKSMPILLDLAKSVDGQAPDVNIAAVLAAVNNKIENKSISFSIEQAEIEKTMFTQYLEMLKQMAPNSAMSATALPRFKQLQSSIREIDPSRLKELIQTAPKRNQYIAKKLEALTRQEDDVGGFDDLYTSGNDDAIVFFYNEMPKDNGAGLPWTSTVASRDQQSSTPTGELGGPRPLVRAVHRSSSSSAEQQVGRRGQRGGLGEGTGNNHLLHQPTAVGVGARGQGGPGDLIGQELGASRRSSSSAVQFPNGEQLVDQSLQAAGKPLMTIANRQFNLEPLNGQEMGIERRSTSSAVEQVGRRGQSRALGEGTGQATATSSSASGGRGRRGTLSLEEQPKSQNLSAGEGVLDFTSIFASSNPKQQPFRRDPINQQPSSVARPQPNAEVFRRKVNLTAGATNNPRRSRRESK